MKFLLITLLSLFSFASMGQTTVTRDTIRVNGTDSVTVFVTTTTTVTRTFSYPEKTTIVTYYKLPNGTTPPPNQLPTCSAGSPQTITLPVNSIALSGSAEDADGKIVTVVWSKLSGGNAVIVSPTTLSTSVTNLVQGTYNFRLSVTDNDGGNCQSNVTVIVNPAQSDNGSVPAGYKQTYLNQFSTQSDLNPGGHSQQGNAKLNTQIYRSAPSSFESIPTSVSGGYRSEIQGESSQIGQEGGFDFWMYFPNYVKTNWGGHAAQAHPDGSNFGGSATVALYFTEGKFTFWRNLGGSNIYQGGSTTGGPMSIQSGVWYHIRVIVKWSRGTDGWLKCYINDMTNPYYSFTGQTQSDNAIPYPKIGQNNFGNSKGIPIIYDDVTYFTKQN